MITRNLVRVGLETEGDDQEVIRSFTAGRRHSLLVGIDEKHALLNESNVALADGGERPRDIRGLALAGGHPEEAGLETCSDRRSISVTE